MNSNRVLVLDGETRTALAVVRSLGRLKLEVGVASSDPQGIAMVSRFAAEPFVSPDAQAEPERYLEWLAECVERWKPRVLLPVTDRSVTLVLGRREQFDRMTGLPFVSAKLFRTVADKAGLVRIAGEIGVAVPRSVEIPTLSHRADDLASKIEALSYPAALKPGTSEVMHGARFVKVGVRYPASAAEVLRFIDPAKNPSFTDIPYLLQEKIPGVGVGVFVLCHRGEVLARFCHRRKLEKPPSGGVSVLCESIPESEAPVGMAERLLQHLGWSGVAMVEFKETPEGDHYLMEINPRFWGSLQLAIDAGVDFPALLHKLHASGPEPTTADLARLGEPLRPYVVGRRLRWFFGSVDHFLIRMKQSPARTLRDVVVDNALMLFDGDHPTRLQVYRRDDTQPFRAEMKRWIADMMPGNRRD